MRKSDMGPRPGTVSDSDNSERLFANPFVRHLSAVLIAKLALLTVLWWAFFHVPERAEVNVERIDAVLLGGPTTPSQRPAFNQGDN